MTLRPLTEHRLEFLSLKGGCTGSSESTLVKIPHCWKSHVATQIDNLTNSVDPNEMQDYHPYNIGIKHVFSSIYILMVPREM